MSVARKIVPFVQKGLLRELENDENDFAYWQSKKPVERVRAITFLVLSSLKSGAKMDRSHIEKRKLKADGLC